MKKIKDIKYGEYEWNILDLYIPEREPFSVFIYFHGGGLESGDKLDAQRLAKYLVPKNIAVVGANYRLYPDAVYPEFIDDAAAAVGWVYKNIKNYGSCERFYIGGSSAGAYLSMMLCFDDKYLEPYGICPANVDGFFHDAGQPTSHFNILRERGIDPRRIIIDETSPLFYIGISENYAPMQFIVSDNDMKNRYEQTMLVLSTLRHFGYEESKYSLTVMNGGHCHYIDENNEDILDGLINNLIEKQKKILRK